jgi:nucleoside-diphosphate-sugar epimerase
MKALVTGASGFIGAGLVRRLRAHGSSLNLQRLVLVDKRIASFTGDERVRAVVGDFGAADVLAEALAFEPDVVFHLASIPGGLAEREFELGLEVNLRRSIELLEALRKGGGRVRFIFASSVAVYGAPMPTRIDEEMRESPSMSYGAHKRIVEMLVADYSRRGDIDGCSLRLPGVVARPTEASGLLSAFMSEAIRELAAGRPFEFPVSASGAAWWMSRECAIDNLLHAASLDARLLKERRTWLLPVLRATMQQVVEAIGTAHGFDARKLARFAPNTQIEAQFAACPPLHCPASVAAGFRHDGSLSELVRRALTN